MVHTIEFDSNRTNIVSVGTPDFLLVEVKKITVRADGACNMDYEPSGQVRFSADTWRKLVAANGDFKAVGIILETNKPVENFEAGWWQL